MIRNLLYLTFTFFIFLTCIISNVKAGNPYINEFHYDNAGSDVNEFVEIAVPTDASCSTLTLSLYNGSDGGTYTPNNINVFSGAMTSVDGGILYVLNITGLQNGSPDGFALVCNGNVLQFLSYEGTMIATNGPAIGLTSTDIGVLENGSGPNDGSISLNSVTGIWSLTTPNTKGALNASQITLPLNLINFISFRNKNGVELNWSTSSEVDHNGFEIEKSTDGKIFNKIGFQNSNGFDNDLNNYTFFDQNINKGNNYYRIKSVDLNGSFFYSKILNVVASIQKEISISYYNSEISFQGIAEYAALKIFDVNGKMLKSCRISNAKTISLTELPKGALFCKIEEVANSSLFKIINL